MTGSRPLAGRRIATTRDEPGPLDDALAALGAEVIHVPLIEIVDAPGTALTDALGRLDEVDWVIVTSRHGAARVAAAVARHPRLRTAAVGTGTADALQALTGRSVDVIPERQLAVDLVEAMPVPGPGADRVLVAVADRAAPTLVDGLRRRGYAVRDVVAYVTRLRTPTPAERDRLARVDAVTFASGSAALAWATSIGVATPEHVIAIGPTTAGVAREAGLQVTAIAADHSVDGLVAEVVRALGPPS